MTDGRTTEDRRMLERLRGAATKWPFKDDGSDGWVDLVCEAADKIERLEVEINHLRAALEMILCTGDLEPNRPLEDCRRYAKEALRR
jgi:hypothetical protein